MMRPSPSTYCAQRATNSSNDSSDSRLPRCAWRTRTRAAGCGVAARTPPRRGAGSPPLHLPHAAPAVAAVLLQHARLAFGEALRQLATELLHCRIETRVGAPAHVARPIEHFLRAHL